MKYVLRFRSEVVGDLEQAAKWYDDRRLGLGGEFLEECKAASTASWIVQNKAPLVLMACGPSDCTDFRTWFISVLNRQPSSFSP